MGILNCGVQHENDPAYALLYDFVDKPDATVRIGAIMGLGLAYAGTRKEEVPSSPIFSLLLAVSRVFLQSMQALHPGVLLLGFLLGGILMGSLA